MPQLEDRFRYITPWQTVRKGGGNSLCRAYCNTTPPAYVARITSSSDWYCAVIDYMACPNAYLGKTTEEIMLVMDQKLIERGYVLLTPEQTKVMELLK